MYSFLLCRTFCSLVSIAFMHDYSTFVLISRMKCDSIVGLELFYHCFGIVQFCFVLFSFSLNYALRWLFWWHDDVQGFSRYIYLQIFANFLKPVTGCCYTCYHVNLNSVLELLMLSSFFISQCFYMYFLGGIDNYIGGIILC